MFSWIIVFLSVLDLLKLMVIFDGRALTQRADIILRLECRLSFLMILRAYKLSGKVKCDLRPDGARISHGHDSGVRRRLFAGMKSLSVFGSRSRNCSPQHRSISLPESTESTSNSLTSLNVCPYTSEASPRKGDQRPATS